MTLTNCHCIHTRSCHGSVSEMSYHVIDRVWKWYCLPWYYPCAAQGAPLKSKLKRSVSFVPSRRSPRYWMLWLSRLLTLHTALNYTLNHYTGSILNWFPPNPSEFVLDIGKWLGLGNGTIWLPPATNRQRRTLRTAYNTEDRNTVTTVRTNSEILGGGKIVFSFIYRG